MADTGPGKIVWRDLTVPNAAEARDFYAAVVGWTAEAVDMGGYEDYSVLSGDGETVAGICWARGTNAGIPAQWLIYIEVPDVAAAARAALERGGAVVDGPRPMGEHQFCVVRDPAGAVFALIGG